ncbi:uncharacterized protein LOC131007838 [Salvia miltiorrhiza]|uniref:uncharacterized protein LOC131007838 n=1 Tax=Salvia miltiorrhiza TaxID=226208 RepID=UPI0025ACD1A2|nr:uncharacterized protein LOC131007838 [Salvia miltiorrhiza]
MGKGFFTIKFKCMEDKKIAKSKSVIELSSGYVRLREWTKFFDPYKESSSLAQIWVRIYNLPLEFWHPEVIAVVGRAVGHPIRMDSSSASGEVGHFARILIEVDLTLPLLDGVYVDEGTSSCFVEFSYESIPPFCSRCRITGHTADKCKRKLKVNPNIVKGQRRADTVAIPSWQPKETTEEIVDTEDETNKENLAVDTNSPLSKEKEDTEKNPSVAPSPSTNDKVDAGTNFSPQSNRFNALTGFHEEVQGDCSFEGADKVEMTGLNPLALVTKPVDTSQPFQIEELQGKIIDPSAGFAEKRDQLKNDEDLKVIAAEQALKIQRLEDYINAREAREAEGETIGHVKK